MRATNQQMQTFSDSRMRNRAELIRSLLAALKDDKANIGDEYEHASGANSIAATWTDNRTDGPAHLAGPNDLLTYNSYITALINNIENAENFTVIMQLCVRPVGAA